MNTNLRNSALALTAFGMLTLAGCASNKEKDSMDAPMAEPAAPADSMTPPPPPPPADTMAPPPADATTPPPADATMPPPADATTPPPPPATP